MKAISDISPLKIKFRILSHNTDVLLGHPNWLAKAVSLMTHCTKSLFGEGKPSLSFVSQ